MAQNSMMSRKLSSSRLVKQFAELNFDDDDANDQGLRAKAENRIVFECAWEVANKGMFFYSNTYLTVFKKSH